MSRFVHLAAAVLFAAIAAASLVGLATAAPQAGVTAESCEAALCLVSFL